MEKEYDFDEDPVRNPSPSVGLVEVKKRHTADPRTPPRTRYIRREWQRNGNRPRGRRETGNIQFAK